MSEQSDETLKQGDSEILKAISELAQKIDNLEKNTNSQFEVIRLGIVHNSSAFDRLKAEVLLLRADLRDLTEEVRQSKKTLV
jgi:hypothetical protein